MDKDEKVRDKCHIHNIPFSSLIYGEHSKILKLNFLRLFRYNSKIPYQSRSHEIFVIFLGSLNFENFPDIISKYIRNFGQLFQKFLVTKKQIFPV